MFVQRRCERRVKSMATSFLLEPKCVLKSQSIPLAIIENLIINLIVEIDNARQWILHLKIEYLNDSSHLHDPSYRAPLWEKTM